MYAIRSYYGYFAQNQAQKLDENLTVLETIDQIAVGDIRTKIRDILGAFMFSGEDRITSYNVCYTKLLRLAS